MEVHKQFHPASGPSNFSQTAPLQLLSGESFKTRKFELSKDIQIAVSRYRIRDLSEQKIHALCNELHDLHAEGFFKDPADPTLQEDLLQHVKQSKVLLIARRNDLPVAFLLFNQFKKEQERVFHLCGIIVAPSFQSCGLGSRLLRTALRQTDADILVFHTQNSQMFKLGSRFAYFSPDLCVELAASVGSKDINGLVEKNRYKNQMYGERGSSIKTLKCLDASNGDAIIFAGRVRV